VNVSSGMGACSEMEVDYAAYRLSLAAELRGRIAVDAARPGWVRTDMGAEMPSVMFHKALTLPFGSLLMHRKSSQANSSVIGK
jgi:hypothetical protein